MWQKLAYHYNYFFKNVNVQENITVPKWGIWPPAWAECRAEKLLFIVSSREFGQSMFNISARDEKKLHLCLMR